MAESPARKRGRGEQGTTGQDADTRTIRAEFNLHSGETSSQESAVKLIDGMKWKLRVRRFSFSLDTFSVYVEKVSDESDYDPYCYVRTRIKLFESACDQVSLKYKCSMDRIGPYSRSSSLTFKDFEMPTTNVGKFYVEAHIKVLRSGSLCETRFFDFEYPSAHSDVILKVEGAKLHVGKGILANQSKFFERLFFGDFKEANEKEIEIKDVSVKEFTQFLSLIYNRRKKVDVCNASFMLKLADRFDCPELLGEYEEALMDNKRILCADELLLMADQYKLHSLLDDRLENMKEAEDVSAFLLSEYAEKISAELREILNYKLLQF